MAGGSSGNAATAVCGGCPRHCRLAQGERGACAARWNVGGRVVPVARDRICALSVDPIEKKPLYHVVPGAPVLSVACAGCTLHCRHCQNAEISQQGPDAVPGRSLPPESLAEELRRSGCRWVAYTYTEPFAWAEYAAAACDAVLAAGGRNILVTSGYAAEAPVRQLAALTAAANVDLKGFSERFYREQCGGTLRPVLRALELFREAGVHLEITNLLIPGLNDAEADLAALAGWVRKNLGAGTPLHFSRFLPRHELADVPPTPVETLRNARALALAAGLQHVYIGNADLEGASDTRCPGCGALLTRRVGYRVVLQRVTPQGRCPDCSASITGVWS